MKMNKTMAIAVLLFALLIAGIVGGVLFSQMSLNASAAPPAQEGDDADEAGDVDGPDDTEDGDTGESGDVEDDDANEAGEVEETVSPDQAAITADEAKAAAEKAYPGTKALEVELESENGVTAYEVELDNGLEVLVSPANGDILGVDTD